MLLLFLTFPIQGNITVANGRGSDQTFMNMTIATYMAQHSEPLGSLTDPNKRVRNYENFTLA